VHQAILGAIGLFVADAVSAAIADYGSDAGGWETDQRFPD